MIERLSKIKKEYFTLKKKLNAPSVIQDPKTFANLSQEFHHLEKTYNLIEDYEKIKKQIQENTLLIKEEKDSDLATLAKEENQNLSLQLKIKEEELKLNLLPKDPNDKKNVILEIRAGAGGDEASLFTQNLFSAYSAYAQSRSWKIDIISISEGNIGGYKEIIANISGFMVYSTLKYESGVHRVQRIP
ncbi:MAG: PCRF domain-containing protein, partial [Oligoflexia bacterium]|nr:PCRF domain-containing protein [Oligoflexia bacterium]